MKRSAGFFLAAVCFPSLGLTAAVSAQSHCISIHFARGTTSTVISGVAPADSSVCYTFAAGEGQTATLKVGKAKNTIFSIDDLVDTQDSYTFTTKHTVYTIRVRQLMRTISAEAVALSVGVR